MESAQKGLHYFIQLFHALGGKLARRLYELLEFVALIGKCKSHFLCPKKTGRVFPGIFLLHEWCPKHTKLISPQS